MVILVAEFIMIAAIIVFCGAKLSKYGDIIAEKTGLGRAWTGLILVATITSLPELITGVSSVTAAGVPDIAAGDILGSCVFNLLILAMLDLMDRGRPIFSLVGQSHLLSAGFGAALLALASASILLEELIPSFFHIGLYTPVFFVTYAFGIKMVYYHEKRFLKELAAASQRRYDGVTLKKAVAMYSANSVAVVTVATALPFVADGIAGATGLSGSFVGTALVAVATSLPELVVSIAALRIGAPDLATGNILGSNMFNICILGIDDLLYTKGPILSDVSGSHAVTGLSAILMTSIALISMTYRHEKKAMRLGWDSFALLALGGLNMYFVYAMGDS